MTYRVLVLTDHRAHSSENSIYELLRTMRRHPLCASVEVATRYFSKNDPFFYDHTSTTLYASPVQADFAFSKEGAAFSYALRLVDVQTYDVIWLRLPPPADIDFLNFLSKTATIPLIINRPAGIIKAGSKRFLTQFPDLCAPMQICETAEQIIAFASRFPIVLKPFRQYGGKGIVKVQGNRAWIGTQEMPLSAFLDQVRRQPIAYLGVKYLKNVAQGDKRIVVVNGNIMGASLRMPPADSWLCNVSMGGTSKPATVSLEEVQMVKVLQPVLSKMGVVMYGVDTLMGDNGKRVLSEINATSIGGLPQIAEYNQLPLVSDAIQYILEYVQAHIY